MKAVVIDRFVESYDEIRISEVPVPIPQGDEFLIQVKAAGVNFVDTLYARGKHQNNRRHIKPPFTLGLEFAGIIVSTPSSASSFNTGDHVFGDFSGAYAEYITVLSSSLHLIPPNWTFFDAAGLAATLPVSYGALLQPQSGNLKPGQTVLIHAAAGGLGLAAVQIAKSLNCTVIGTAGSEDKCRTTRRYGADSCLNYQTETEWWNDVLRLTGGKGVDLVFDSVGLVDRSLKCLAHRGRILIVGFAGREGNMEDVKMNRLLLKQAQIIGYRYGESSRRYPEETDQIWHELYQMVEKGTFKPTRFEKEYKGLESIPEALSDIASRKVWGKAVIRVDTGSQNEQNVAAKL